MSAIIGGGQTPTDLRVRKVSENEYVVDFIQYRPADPSLLYPQQAQCGQVSVKARAFVSLDAAIDFIRTYLEAGDSCFRDAAGR